MIVTWITSCCRFLEFLRFDFDSASIAYLDVKMFKARVMAFNLVST